MCICDVLLASPLCAVCLSNYLCCQCTYCYLIHGYTIAVISHAMARDGSSGGVIRLVIIDKTGIEKEVILGNV